MKAMTQTTLSAAGLIELRSAQQRGDERVRPIIVHDLALADWPERSMMFDPNRVESDRYCQDSWLYTIFHRTN